MEGLLLTIIIVNIKQVIRTIGSALRWDSQEKLIWKPLSEIGIVDFLS